MGWEWVGCELGGRSSVSGMMRHTLYCYLLGKALWVGCTTSAANTAGADIPNAAAADALEPAPIVDIVAPNTAAAYTHTPSAALVAPHNAWIYISHIVCTKDEAK